MRLLIAAIGKLRGGPEATLVETYLKRAEGMGRQLGFSGPTVAEFDAPRSLAGAARQEQEGGALLRAAAQTTIIALDERGKNLTSKDFSKLLEKYRDDGAPGLSFLIGGADGHAAAVLERADAKISLGAATWPHLLVRVMLTEQIYRSMTMMTGHPYHRA